MTLLARVRALFERGDPRPHNPWFGFPSTGIRVDHDSALKYSAVYSCVRVITETIAPLGWHHFTRTTADQKERLRDTNTARLLDRAPNPEMTPMSFRESILGHAATWGNGYAEIQRDRLGRPVGLWPVPANRVEPVRVGSELAYEIRNVTRAPELIPARDMFHVHGLGDDGVVGYSVIRLAAQSIGLGLAGEEFGASFFGNGASVGGVLTHPKKLGDKALANLRQSLEKGHKGRGQWLRPMILEEGMSWTQTGIPPDDAQFLETRKFQIQEIARWFRVPPHKLADLERATFSNIEQQSIDFVADAIVPWVTRLEQEADRKLLGNPNHFTRINVNALLRGDSESRSKFYQSMFQMGVFSVNEIRAIEGMNDIGPDGEVRLVPMNMQRIEDANKEPEPVPAQLAPGAQPDEDEDDDEEPMNAARVALRAAFARCLRREAHTVARNGVSAYDGLYDYMLGELGPLMEIVSSVSGVELGSCRATLDAFCHHYCRDRTPVELEAVDDFADECVEELLCRL